MLSSKLQSPVIKRGEQKKGVRLRHVIFNHLSLVFQYIGGAASLIFRASKQQHKQGGDETVVGGYRWGELRQVNGDWQK